MFCRALIIVNLTVATIQAYITHQTFISNYFVAIYLLNGQLILGGTNIYFWVALLSSDKTFHWLPFPLLFNYETYGNNFQELQHFKVLFCCAYFLPSLSGVLCILSCEANLHIFCETEYRFILNYWLNKIYAYCLVLTFAYISIHRYCFSAWSLPWHNSVSIPIIQSCKAEELRLLQQLWLC